MEEPEGDHMNEDTIPMRCPSCQAALRIPASFAGKKARCRKCQTTFPVPVSRESPPVPKAPAKAQAPPSNPVKSSPREPMAPVGHAPVGHAPVGQEPPPSRAPAPGVPHAGNRKHSKVPIGAWVALIIMSVLTLGSATLACFLYLPGLSRDPFANHDPGAQAVNDGMVDKGGEKGPAEKDMGKANNDARFANSPFPRRALFIAVNNYLFNNPVQQGPGNTWKGLDQLKRRFEVNLRFPTSQTLQISDALPGTPAPTKQVIEKNIGAFTASSRAQDCIVVWFTGHIALAGDKACLVPIEGELDTPASLITLESVFKALKDCKARQKVLVLDVCHYSPSIGHERPGSDPMAEAIEKQALAAPEGVQVWLPCQKDQNSFETDEDPMGVFASTLHDLLREHPAGEEARDKPVDFAKLNDLVQKGDTRGKKPILGLKDRLEGAKRDGKPGVMVSMLSGAVAGAGHFNPDEPIPEKLAAVPGPRPDAASVALMNDVFKEISTPPIKQGHEERALRVELLPAVPNEIVKDYALAAEGEDTDLRVAVRNARINLWSISNAEPPADIRDKVQGAKARNKKNLEALVDYYGKPGDENRFKTDVERNQRDVAGVFAVLEEDLETLTNDEMKNALAKEPKRWQANYRYVVSRLEAQIAFLYEYQSMLGAIRKEFPPLEKNHNGWRLASSTKLRGDRKGQQLAKSASGGYEKLGKDTAGSPWAILAKRDRLTALGLEWQSSAGRKE